VNRLKGLKVGQFLSTTFSQRGGGERVQYALYKLFGAKIYNFKKRLKGKEYKEIGDEVAKKIMNILPK